MSYRFDPYWPYWDVWYGFGTQGDADENFRREFGKALTLTVVDFTGMDEEAVNHIKACGVNFARKLTHSPAAGGFAWRRVDSGALIQSLYLLA
jgi:hypothetical protein